MIPHDRRQFLKFIGAHSTLIGLGPLLNSCASVNINPKELGFAPISPSFKDDLILAGGFSYSTLIKWDTLLNKRGDRFGFNNDYIAFLPQGKNRALLWVNHESAAPIFVSDYKRSEPRTRQQIVKEQKAVGGSFLEIRKENDQWKFVNDSSLNSRIDAQTKIKIVAERPIEGRRYAIGTLANCAGGVTPWGTVLTCEENYYKYYGDSFFNGDKVKKVTAQKYLNWDRFFDYPAEHYGWVVEIDPKTKSAKKLTALGRFAHEGATCTRTKDGRVVVYSGDDKNDECIYKFISRTKNSLHKGDLYAADIKGGRWVHLSLDKNPLLEKFFKDQTELLIHARKAAHELGATALDRPEDIEIDPKTGNVFIALTNNKPKKNYHGSILKIVEKNGDAASMEFTSDTFIAGGSDNGFSAPDNLVFDRKGNLWITTDISGDEVGKPPYTQFKNNGLFYVPLSGKYAGQAFQVASAPVDAELTGPCFSDDGRTLFLSVQHPGELSKSKEELTSHWPDGANSLPKPSVVQISGEAMDRLVL